MTKQQVLQDQMDDIMDSFEFDKVHEIMKHLKWEWASTDGVPDEYDIRQQARKAMKYAIECNGIAGTGGFHAEVNDEEKEGWVRLNLFFGLSTINDGVEYEKKS